MKSGVQTLEESILVLPDKKDTIIKTQEDEKNTSNSLLMDFEENYSLITSKLTVDKELYKSLKSMLSWFGYEIRGESNYSDESLLECLNYFLRDRNLTEVETFEVIALKEVVEAFKLTIASPDGNKGVRKLKSNLNDLGFGKVIVSDKLGNVGIAKMKEFQLYYNLPNPGTLNLEVLVKMDEILSSTLSVGDIHDVLVFVKRYLNIIYTRERIRLSSKFGRVTERVLKKYQKKKRLPVNGRLDENLIILLREEVSNLANKNKRKNASAKYVKETLNKLGFAGIDTKGSLGAFATARLKEFQEFYNLEVSGSVNVDTLLKFEELLSSPYQLDRTNDKIVTLKEDLISLGYGPIARSKKFGRVMQKRVRKFQREHDLPVNGIIDSVTMKKIEKLTKITEKKTFNYLDISFEEAMGLQFSSTNQNNLSKDAFSKTRDQFNPEILLKDEKGKFQLLDISRPRVVTIDTLNVFLEAYDSLKDLGEVFLDTALEFGISEIVLVSCAVNELSNENSIVNGIPVDKKGKITYLDATVNEEIEKVPGVTEDTYTWVYNTYGITDNDDLEGKARKAFEEGWYSMERAISGGAIHLKELFIGDGRSTIYKKKWESPTHSGIYSENKAVQNEKWIIEQFENIYNIYKELDSYTLYLDIPVYKKDKA